MNKLKDILKEQGRSHKWLASKLEVSPATIRNWINNKTKPDIDEVVDICKILCINIEELIEGK